MVHAEEQMEGAQYLVDSISACLTRLEAALPAWRELIDGPTVSRLMTDARWEIFRAIGRGVAI